MPRKPQESFGKLGRGKPASKVIRVCPKCKNATLKPEATLLMGFITGRQFYHCTNCGYSGSLYLEVDVDDYDRYQREGSLESSSDENNSGDLEPNSDESSSDDLEP